ncbi:hypothetical protein WMY93_027599 [Mugilogobius chulae]|uniref:Natriuretic peptides B n=1 Tax=Mugilogobius chulae TaxID=88201 RepID=A0AAW0MV40_9GOBI
MRNACLWGLLLLLPLLCLCPGARGHSLGRVSEAELDQIRSVLQRLEASLSTAPDDVPEELEQANQRSLLDLLLSARRSSSGCFGARMDRIGNASGLGCGRG